MIPGTNTIYPVCLSETDTVGRVSECESWYSCFRVMYVFIFIPRVGSKGKHGMQIKDGLGMPALV